MAACQPLAYSCIVPAAVPAGVPPGGVFAVQTPSCVLDPPPRPDIHPPTHSHTHTHIRYPHPSPTCTHTPAHAHATRLRLRVFFLQLSVDGRQIVHRCTHWPMQRGNDSGDVSSGLQSRRHAQVRLTVAATMMLMHCCCGCTNFDAASRVAAPAVAVAPRCSPLLLPAFSC